MSWQVGACLVGDAMCLHYFISTSALHYILPPPPYPACYPVFWFELTGAEPGSHIVSLGLCSVKDLLGTRVYRGAAPTAFAFASLRAAITAPAAFPMPAGLLPSGLWPT